MAKFVVVGGKKLSGKVRVQGSKNAAFPVIAASILTKQTCEISNVPDIGDVRKFLRILKIQGASVDFRNNTLTINSANLKDKPLPKTLVRQLRGSILLSGAMLGRFGHTKLAYPGGCRIGARPIDVHLDGFKKLGAVVKERGDTFVINAKNLAGAKIVLAVTSVTGTENLVLASVLARGKTEIRLAASEPHVQDLCRFLNKMGAKIRGIGTTNLKITGVSKLKGAKHRVCSDEIDAITLCVAAAATKGRVRITDVVIENLDAPLAAMERMGVNFKVGKNYIQIEEPENGYRGTRIITGVYPQLLTDEQPLFGVLATQAKGKTSIHDWVYEGRQGYLKKLQKMGANVEFDDEHRARIYGPTKLQGAEIKTPDLRAGAAILIASLVARGRSIIYNAEMIDRGYERLDQRLASLGAEIKRVD